MSNEYLLRDIPVDLHKELKIQAVRKDHLEGADAQGA